MATKKELEIDKISYRESKHFPEPVLLLFLRKHDDRPEFPFGDFPRIKRIAESFQVFPSFRAEPEEAQDLGNPGMG